MGQVPFKESINRFFKKYLILKYDCLQTNKKNRIQKLPLEIEIMSHQNTFNLSLFLHD